MRRLTWPLLICVAIIWIAIAHYWTGTDEARPEPREIFLPPVATPAPLTIAITPEATPASTPAIIVTNPPTQNPDDTYLRY